jgi:hypothetical protein
MKTLSCSYCGWKVEKSEYWKELDDCFTCRMGIMLGEYTAQIATLRKVKHGKKERKKMFRALHKHDVERKTRHGKLKNYDQYIRTGLMCPYCKSPHVIPVRMDLRPCTGDDGHIFASRPISCYDCMKTWYDVYKLYDIDPIQLKDFKQEGPIP